MIHTNAHFIDTRIRAIIFFGLCIVCTPHADAYVPNIVNQESLSDITTIADPTLAQGFFGTLDGFPHTYEIRMTEPFVLSIHIRTPDVASHTDTVSGIVVKEKKRGVLEIARLHAEDASWDVRTDFLTGTSYREGTSFTQELEPGVYRVEVHTPDNNEKYILMIGEREDMTIGYGELIGRLIDLQKFHERWSVWVITSPYVYVPLLVSIGIGITVYLWYRRKQYAQ